MKITVTTTATSFYDLALAWLQANHSKTVAESQILLDQIDLSNGLQFDIQTPSTIYFDRGLTATTTTSVALDVGLYRLTLAWLKNINFIASGNTDVNIAIDWIF
jgi:hypothetical protein